MNLRTICNTKNAQISDKFKDSGWSTVDPRYVEKEDDLRGPHK